MLRLLFQQALVLLLEEVVLVPEDERRLRLAGDDKFVKISIEIQ
jgi:hypothetical protein